VYKPLFEREEDLIRKEFVSEDVMDVLRDKSRVELRNVNDEEDAEKEVVPYEEMPPYERPVKKPPKYDDNTPQPEDVQAHTIYICKKHKIEEEEEHVAEEQEEQEESEY